jgi:hypothetical protein
VAIKPGVARIRQRFVVGDHGVERSSRLARIAQATRYAMRCYVTATFVSDSDALLGSEIGARLD